MEVETGPEVNKQRKFVRQKRSFRRRNTGHKIQPVRRIIQLSFFLITLWIGFEFAQFVHQLEQGIIPTVSRPPGVEGFLPISALISLKYWLLTGVFNTIHPSALVLLLIILVSAIFLKKGFCSWVCPVGFISELLTKLHKMVFDRQFKLATWLDYPLRTLKYLLMLFFLFAVFVQMRLVDLHHFIYSPYNKIADIKMLRFFTEMSSVTFWTLLILVVFSFAIQYFWCRFLCPYGALLGGLSFLSPFKIHRGLVGSGKMKFQ
ncbi:MAG: 4Fe-4S binding protein [Calditrichia bacterium]